MATIKQFEDLEIWQNARMICKKINDLTKKENFRKDFALIDQIRRSSGSAMDNIAEGFERDGNREFVQFLNISKGSIGETRSQLYRAMDYEYISEQVFEIHKTECLSLSKQIRSFSDYLKRCEYKGHKFK
jgi:four helix bundle protein